MKHLSEFNFYLRYSETIGRGEFLQFSGVQVTYNLTQPSGSRVQSVKLRCSSCAVPRFYDIEENRTYNVIITSFVSEGGDGYTMFKNKRTVPMEVADLQATIDYIKAMKTIYQAVEWRVTLNGKVREEEDEEEEDEEEEEKPKSNARHVNTSFVLTASVAFLYLFRIIKSY